MGKTHIQGHKGQDGRQIQSAANGWDDAPEEPQVRVGDGPVERKQRSTTINP